jgi:hypothetical protein
MVLFQDELEALEALCFLSTGQVPDVQASNVPGSKRSQQHGRQSKYLHPKSKQQKRQQPSRKPHARLSPGSETSSGATQCGLGPAQAAELQLLPELPMAVEEIHPAAIASPEVAQLLQQQHLLSQMIQQQDKQQHAAESSDTRLLVSALTPAPSDDYAEQSRQCTPGSQVVPASPEPQQIDVAAASAGVAATRTAPQPGQSLVLQQPEQQVPVISKPPVKGCFWHVYIAKMIQTDQHRKEKQQKGKQQQQASPSKRPQQQEAAAGAGAVAAVAPAKKRRSEQQQLQHQAGTVATAAVTPAGMAGMSAAHQQAAAVQHVLVQTLLQQQQSSAGAGVSVLLGQQMPGVLQLLQALTAASGVRPVVQLPASAPSSPLDMLSGLTPAVAAGAASCPQLLQALGAAAGGRRAFFAAPAFTASTLAPAASRFSGAAATTVARPLTSVMGSSAQGGTAAYMGSVPAVAGPNVGQVQAMFGQLPGFMSAPAVAAAPGWPGYGQVSAVLGVTGMQPHVFPGRVAV